MSSTPPPNIRDLAARLGISHTTVSLALRNHPSVAEATRRRVQDLAKKTGYHSNALVNALMAQVRKGSRIAPSGEVVAYLTSHSGEDDWRRHPSHLQQFEGAKRRAEELGFMLQPMWLGDRGLGSRQMDRILGARGVRGAILAPLAVDHHTLELDWAHRAVVTIGYSFRQVPLHRTVHDNVSLMEACYQQLKKLGHKRIGLVLHETDSARVRHLWVTGYLGAQWRFGGARLAPMMFEDFDDDRPFLKWVKKTRPDAVIGVWRDQPLDWLRNNKISVPAQVGYATLDLGDRVGKIAGMQQDNTSIGMAAMDMLAGQLFRSEIGMPISPKVTLVEGTWMDGPTANRRPES